MVVAANGASSCMVIYINSDYCARHTPRCRTHVTYIQKKVLQSVNTLAYLQASLNASAISVVWHSCILLSIGGIWSFGESFSSEIGRGAGQRLRVAQGSLESQYIYCSFWYYPCGPWIRWSLHREEHQLVFSKLNPYQLMGRWACKLPPLQFFVEQMVFKLRVLFCPCYMV